jgi:hypothetical protein
MARDSFDFDSVNLTDGGFYHSAGDAQGTMMIGWGRRRNNKWVQLSQSEIGSFLAAGHEMLRTDDPAVKEALTGLAAAIAGSKPRWENLAALLAQVETGDETARDAATQVNAKILGGMPLAEALAEVNTAFAPGAKPGKAVRAVPKAS